ncbi:5-formyltetrahydrofolate cyclo-ligase [Mycoplasmoides alvi]|uniref:5-formyltetrahydrofolate cyclo-ligase n=1 Tax=Mycoplasmoides alvi TaxID=78580 RepID=UPI00051BC088|nr:5-formyltetrahydrofolate cyclo-ligase [Mycoplasmoides alvi]
MFLFVRKLKYNNIIRNKKISERNEISFIEYNKLNELIFNNFFIFLSKYDIKSIAFYLSTKNEVNTKKIISKLLEKKINISLPQVINNKDMIFRKINSLNFDYEYFKNIKQPSSSNLFIKPNEIQMMVIPLIAYNKKMFRLGYGSGFYDKFLNKNDKQNKILKVGFAYNFQQDENFLVHKHDKKLDFIINENEVIE